MKFSLDEIKSTRTKKAHKSGTDRLISPRETFDRVRPYFSEIGLTRVANVTGLDVIGIPVIMSVRPNSRSLAVHQGKGLTLEAAKTSAVMESLERWHAENIVLPLRLGTLKDIEKSERALDLARHELFEKKGNIDDRRFLWIEGNDLIRDSPVWVPYDIVTMDFRSDGFDLSGPDIIPRWGNSNGLASGNHPMEALVHALCELIERDVTRRNSKNNLMLNKGLDLTTVDDKACREVLEMFWAAGITVAVWDQTSDLDIPTFTCSIGEDPDVSHRPLPINTGHGTHLRREIALLRALTEAAQARLTFISGARDDIPKSIYDYERDRRRIENAWKFLRLSKGTRDFHRTPTHPHLTFEEDIIKILDMLKSKRQTSEIVTVDLSREDMGIPVVKVIVPDLLGVDVL